MAIRIVRNANGNCVQFVGSSQPVYWNACLSGAVNDEDNTRVDVINDIRTTDSDNPFFEFFGIPYTDFQDKDGNSFANATEAAAYITAQANVLGGAISFSATDTLDVSRDATNTNLLFSTGDSYGVNSIKAVAQDDGNIMITENVDDGAALFVDIRPANVTVGGDSPTSTTANAVVNTLNALFTVTPIGSGGVDPASSFSTIRTSVTNADFTVFGDVTESALTYTKGSNTGSTANDGMYSTNAVLTQEGEYFEFDVTGETSSNLFGGAFVMGFKNSADSVTEITSNTESMGGLDLSVRFRGMSSYESHDYGIVIENGFYNNPKSHKKFRLGLDADRRLYISQYDVDRLEWQVIVRSAFPTTTEEYRIVFFLKMENAYLKLNNASNNEIDPAGVTLQYRYIESPDGEFYYPLFATTAEAEWVDQVNGGSGTYHSHVFSDELPTSNTWYMPTSGGTHAGASAPSNTDDITYTEILTGDDANYAPQAFGSAPDYTVNHNVSEGSTLNYQIDPAGANWTTTISGQPAGLSLSGGMLVGTAPEVTGTIATNPTDVYPITVTRTNVFGTTTGTLNLTVANLTTTITAITGFTHDADSDTMVDSDTLADGSVVGIDNVLDDGNRIVFSASWMNTYVRDAINAAGSGASIFIGFRKETYPTGDFATVDVNDFDFGYKFEYLTGGNSLYVRKIRGGSVVSNVTHSNFNNDMVFFHDYSVSGYMLVSLAAPGNGATMATSTYTTGEWLLSNGNSRTVFIGATGMTMDISATGISEVANPVVPTSGTSWTKALDFSGGAERVQLANGDVSREPIAMGHVATTITSTTTGNTSNDTNARPWATACVFRADGNASNQHIWNMGSGASNGADNIYVRLDSSRRLYFGWGREGEGVNECYITQIASNIWYGLYVGHDGRRWGANGATATNLSNSLDIRLISGYNNFGGALLDAGQYNNWNHSAATTGYRMDRAVDGDFTIGGRGSNRNFHGKVASMVVTTLKRNVAMPSDAEIEKMIKDPVGWMDDYKVGESFRRPTDSNIYNGGYTWRKNDGTSAYATQVWLMGDGTNDAYSEIRNQVHPSDSVYSKLNMLSMVSNDIETVTIPGLS